MRVQSIIVKGIFAILVALPLICNSLAFGERWTVESLQKEIDARGYKWKAGKTALSDTSLEEFIKLASEDFCDLPDPYMMPAEERITLPDDFPTYLDWRDYKGGNWISPLKNQLLTCLSCYAFGPLGTMESLIKLYYNDPDLPVDLSEQYMVSCVQSGFRCDKGPYAGGCFGHWIDYAWDFLVDNGVPDEACFPYQNPQWPSIEPPCSNVCNDVEAKIHKLSSYSLISGSVAAIPYPENIKAVLVNKPVTCNMVIYFDWLFYTGGIYKPIAKTKGAGHSVQIIGFDDTQQCWIGRDSQGTDWGETVDFKPYTPGAGDGGYFRVPYVTSLENTKTYFGIFAVDAYYDGGPPVLPYTSTTTTTISCPSEELYGENSEELALLRHFRDAVLNQTPEGREIIKLYYQWSPFVLNAMQEDEEFKETIKEMIDEILMAIIEGGSNETN